MIRSAAKNFKFVAVLCNPNDYKAVIDELKLNDFSISYKTRKKLLADAFNITADYDSTIAIGNGQIKRCRVGPFII